jgi:hypothetical protein
MKITRVVSIIIVTFFSLVGSSDHALAQTANPPKIFLTKSLGNITVSLDTLSGRFAVRCADGRSILFGSEFSNTSHISVKIGKRIYSNYWWIKRSVTPPNVYDLGKGAPEVLSDRLRYTWTVHNRDGDYAITQDLTPTQDTTWNEALVQISVRCVSGKPTTAGVTVQMDINAGGNDKAPITINGSTIRNETVYTRDIVPDAWTVRTPEFGKETITGRLTAPDCMKPDRIVAGNWQTSGDLGIAVYGYGSVGHSIGDGAVFYEWTERSLDGAGEFAIASRVGIRVPPDTLGRYFGTEFFNYQNGYGVYFFHATEPTQVHIHQYGDNSTEGQATWDKGWDSTVTIQPGFFTPVSFFAAERKSDYPLDYRVFSVRITSDKPIGIQFYGSSVCAIPRTMPGDTSFFYPGTHQDGGFSLVNSIDDTMLVDLLTVGDETSLNYPYMSKPNPKGTNLSLNYPAHGMAEFHTSISPYHPHRQYWEYCHTSRDGVGMKIKTNKPAIMMLNWGNLPWYVMCPDSVANEGGGYGDFIVSSTNDGGKEFVIIPFIQNYTPAVDLVRIIPFEDGTTVRFSDSGGSFMLQAGEHLDTLLSQPEVIKSDKPIAVYQSPARTILFTQRTDIVTGSLLAIPSLEKWGKSYYSISGIRNIPAKWQRGRINEMPWLPELQFIRIVRENHNRDAVYLNGMEVDFTTAFKTGNYSYIDVQHISGFDVVECAGPILVMTYGGFGTLSCNYPTTPVQIIGYANIPLHK